MPALSDTTTWRKGGYNQKTYLYLHAPATIFAARVNQASTTYPASTVTFDTVTTGAYTDVRAGMLVAMGSSAGASDLGRHYVKSITSTAINFGRFSRGVRDGELDVTDNAYITIYELYPVFAKILYINDSGTILTWGGTSFSANAANLPKANAGGPRVGFVDAGTSLLTCDFDGTASFTQVGGGLTYAWNFVDGTPSSATTSTVTGVTFPVGSRYCSLTVTDSNSITHTVRFPVVALDRTSTTSYIQNFEGTLTSRHDGQELSCLIRANIPASIYPDGTFAILFKEEQYGTSAYTDGLAGLTGRKNILFYGWHQSDPAQIAGTREGIRKNVTLNFVDVAGRLKTLPAFTQEISNAASPATWAEMSSANVDKYLYRILQQYSSALDVSDFANSGTGSTYNFARLGSNGGTLWEQAAERAEAVGKLYKLTCDRYGRLAMKAYPLRQSTGSRTVTSIISLTGDDIVSIEYIHTRPPQVHWLNGDAVKTGSSTAVQAMFAVAPGGTPGQGATAQVFGQMLATSQANLNAVVGNEYARLNATESDFTLALTHNGDAWIDPALMEWVTLTLSSSEAAQRGLTFTNERFLPTVVETTFNGRTGQVRRAYTLFRETSGTAATTVTGSTAESTIVAPVPIFDNGSQGGIVTLVAFTSNGYRCVTSNFNRTSAQGGPTWTATALTVAGTVLQFVENAFSPLRINGTGALNGWLLTTERIYSVSDAFGACTLTSRFTFSAASSQRSIDASFGVENHVVCVSHESTDTKAVYSTDGTTFTEVTITTETNTSADATCPGCWVSSRNIGYVYTTAYTTTGAGTGAERNGYRSPDYGATWVAWSGGAWSPRLTSSGFGNDQLASSINIPFADTSQTIAYYGSTEYSITNRLYRTNPDQTTTNIAPTPGGVSYGPGAGRDKISVSPVDPNRILLCGNDATGVSNIAVFGSLNGGATWVTIDAATSNYRSGAIVGDGSACYLFGISGAIAYLENFTAAIDSRKGDLDGATVGTIIAIAGG